MTSLTTREKDLDAIFRKLYPDLSDEEAKRAQYNFDRYIALVVRIADRFDSGVTETSQPA